MQRSLLKSLGPGLLFAGAAIGVSHLVQSTRAGESYGFALVWVVLLANLFKYPFFEFGPRYAAATGESLLDGYQRLGNWTMAVFLLLTFGTMFTVQAAVTLVTAAIMSSVTGVDLFYCSIILFAVCMAILAIGRYALLDTAMKGIIVILSISTLIALVIAFLRKDFATMAPAPPIWDRTGILFLVPLMGWMPSAIDISVWHSLWTLERKKQTGHTPSLRDSLFDFNLGYIVTALLALSFLSLGALVMYGSSQGFSNNPVVFAGQFVNLYSQSLGDWIRPVILLTAFTTMFSTTLTVTDAFPRVLQRSCELLFFDKQQKRDGLYWGWMVVVCGIALVIIRFFIGNIKQMVDIATALSFLTAPILAYINYRVVTGDHMPPGTTPPSWLRILSWIGIVFLSGFCVLYLYTLSGVG